MKGTWRPIFLLTLLVSALWGLEERHLIQKKTIRVKTPIRVKAITEKSELINNMLSWQPLSFIEEDGALVKKGDVLASYKSEELDHQMQSLLLNRSLIDANLNRRLAEIDNKNLEMDDNMEALSDTLASLQSRLARQKSEPTADDIRIVEGRLRIAKMNAEAARKDFQKAQERFKKELISRAELETKERDMLEKEAKLTFAEQECEYTKNPPARAGQIRSTELDIEINKLEIEKLTYEIQEQRDISEIQKRGAYVNQERNQRQINERQADMERVVVKSPISGVVNRRRPYGNELTPGYKMWYGLCFMEIPDLKTIAFKGTMQETRRRFHHEDDAVTIRLNGHKDEIVKGRIKQISTLSHDIVEKDDEGMSGKHNIGVKVFDVTVALTDAAPSWLLPGVYGEAELIAEREVSGPVVPIQFVKQLDGKYYISIEGVYQEVTGTRIDTDFLLDNSSLLGREVMLGGILPEQKRTNGGEEEKRLSASGEILPVNSTKILIDNIGRGPWCEITWLIPEETYVKKGDVVARLDSTERDKYVQAAEESATEYRSRKEELEKNLVITERTGVFREKVAAFRLESARINAEQTLKIVRPIPLYRAQMNLKLAEIKEKYQRLKVEREEQKKTPTVSPVERRKMKRELERAQLRLEDARIALEIEQEGSTKIAKNAAKLRLFEAENSLQSTIRQAAYNNLSIKGRYERSCVHLRRSERYLKQRMDNVANLTVRAPVDGLITYNKININGVVSKVAVGNTVGQNFNILSIPNLNQMEIKVELDEKYYSDIRVGMPVEVRLPSMGEDTVKGTVSKIDLLFSNRAKKDSQLGLYSSHEPLGEVTFQAHVVIDTSAMQLKPGLVGEVFFPIPK